MNTTISRSILFGRACFVLLSAVGLTGLLAYGGRNLLPATLIFEVCVFGTCLIFAGSINRRLLLPAIAFSGYVVLSYTYAVGYGGAHPLDFLLIYKSFIYCIFLAFLAGKKSLHREAVRKIVHILMAMFFLKYAYSIVFGLSARPDMFAENNFELMFIALLFYLKFSLYSRVTPVEVLLIISIFVMSGSRSGIAILFFVMLMIYMGRVSLKRLMGGAIIALLLGALAVVIFSSRASSRGLEGVDRYVFLLVFLNDVSDWGLIKYFFGVEPITPMSDFACKRLSFYKNLFSYSNSKICYSNVLHSYVLRVIYDHGLAGLTAILSFSALTLRVSGYPARDVYAFVGIVLLNSLSVSAFNSVYFALGFALVLISIRPDERRSNYEEIYRFEHSTIKRYL